MDDFDATDIIEINETVTVWTRYLDSSSEDKNSNNNTDPEVEAMLPAYIAYTSFVLFRYVYLKVHFNCQSSLCVMLLKVIVILKIRS